MEDAKARTFRIGLDQSLSLRDSEKTEEDKGFAFVETVANREISLVAA